MTDNSARVMRQLAQDLKQLKDRDLSRRFSRALASGTLNVRRNYREEASRTLPKAGGLATDIGKASVTTKKSTGRIPSLSVRVTQKNIAGKKRDLGSLNQGKLRHPVYARTDRPRTEWRWVGQAVPPGMWDRVVEKCFTETRSLVLTELASLESEIKQRKYT